jgi:hypothetical protein
VIVPPRGTSADADADADGSADPLGDAATLGDGEADGVHAATTRTSVVRMPSPRPGRLRLMAIVVLLLVYPFDPS